MLTTLFRAAERPKIVAGLPSCAALHRWYAGYVIMKATVLPADPNSLSITVGIAPGCGRGIFARRKIAQGETIERAPVIVIPENQWPDLENSILCEYAFDWGEHDEQAAIALGYVSIYNHSYTPNAKLEQLMDELMMEIVALKDIEPDEEITINYNGDPENRDPLWFTTAGGGRHSKRKR